MQEVIVIKGSDRPLKLQLVEVDECGIERPVDLSSTTEIKACFYKSDGTLLELTETGGKISKEAGASGIMSIDWDEADTDSLRTGAQQSFEVEYVIATKTSIAQFENILTVKDRICS